MKMKIAYLAVAFSFIMNVLPVVAQTNVGKKVEQVSVRDSRNNPIPLPHFGEKHLLIFYVDPDARNQNAEFIEYLEENKIKSDKIFSFGVANLADTFLPNSLVRTFIRLKEKKVNEAIYTDPEHLLRDAWNIGDVNGKLTVIFITKDKKIAYYGSGELSKAQIDEFFKTIDKYK
ncbi:MAG: hypothetical protein ACRCX4_01055 [Bacteroidales bacterium]